MRFKSDTYIKPIRTTNKTSHVIPTTCIWLRLTIFGYARQEITRRE